MKPGRSLAWTVGVGTVVAILFLGLSAWLLVNIHALQSQADERGQSNQQILLRLQNDAKTRSAEIKALEQQNEIGAVILKDAALEEQYLSEQEHNICVVTPGCVLVQYPTLLPIPPSIPLPDP